MYFDEVFVVFQQSRKDVKKSFKTRIRWSVCVLCQDMSAPPSKKQDDSGNTSNQNIFKNMIDQNFINVESLNSNKYSQNAANTKLYSIIQQEYSIIAEYNMLLSENLHGVYVIPSFESSFIWFGVIFIRSGHYEGGVFRFTILLPETFPDSDCPSVVFQSQIFHPAIDPNTGNLSLNEVFPKWTKSENHIWQILKYIHWIFKNINIKTPANSEALKIYKTNKVLFAEKAKESVMLSIDHLYDEPPMNDKHYICFSPYDPTVHDAVKVHMRTQAKTSSNTNQGLSWVLPEEFCAHNSNVNCLAMGHKSNQVLVTGGDDKKVNLWAIGREGCLLSLSGHTTPVECVSFCHSESMVCAGSQMGNLKIWDLEAAKLIRTMTGHKEAIKCMDFHPYGGYLTTGSCDMNIRLWDIRQRGCICTYSSHRMAVNSLQFSPDGQWIASGGDEGAVKVWDVRIGRVLKEFSEHTDSVTCVKFHPHEFLLATCSTDKTVNFWDMEKFQLVSATEKMKSPIRQLWFSEDGMSLLGAGIEGLLVFGWEPARQFDIVPAFWGQIYDMTVHHSRLVVGWFHSTNVVLNAVNLQRVHPFGGPPPSEPIIESSPFQKNTSVRKSFSKERPKQVVHRKSLLDEKTIEESGTEEEEIPAEIPNFTDYTNVFCPSRSLNRTPPPSTSLISPPESLSGVEQPSLLSTELQALTIGVLNSSSPPYHSAPTSLNNDPPLQYTQKSSEIIDNSMGDSDNEVKFVTYVSQPKNNIPTPKLLRRQHSDGENKKKVGNSQKMITDNNQSTLKSSSSEMSLGRPRPPSRSLSFSKPVQTSDLPSSSQRNYSSITNKSVQKNPSVEIYVSPSPAISMPQLASQERSPSPEFIPISTDRPVGLDLQEFLPKSKSGFMPSHGELSEQEALNIMMRGHESMMTVLSTRQRSLQIFHSMWMSKNLKVALESTVAAGDLAVILDILNVIVHRPSIWNLDICAILLPQINLLLQSKYESYMTTGCTALRLILRNFSSVIATNVRGSGGVGVDIPREERIARCRRCRDLLLDVRDTLQTRRPQHPRLTALFADLQSLIDQNFQ